MLLWSIVLLLITMGKFTDTHKAQILAYPNANHSIEEIGRKLASIHLQFANFLLLTQVECQSLVTLLFQCHFLGRGTQALEPKTIFLQIGNLVL